jgi:hypothetical protein
MVETHDPLHWHSALFDMLWQQGEMPSAFAHPGWSVYRNTTQLACHTALRANYPALATLTGDEAFGVLTRAYMQQHRPGDARLMHWGDQLPEFLAQFQPAQDWPHLVDVARLDRYWVQAHVAPDAPALSGADVLQATDQSAQRHHAPHPSARWLWSPHPIASLWQSARQGQTQSADLAWQAQGLLLTRIDGEVCATPISHQAVCFLDACARGDSLLAALTHAGTSDPAGDLSAVFALVLQQAALCREFTPTGEPA